MAENAQNKVLKSLKASEELHREIKMESARTGEKIENLVESAWRAFKAKSIPNSGKPQSAEKSSDKIGDSPDASEICSFGENLKPEELKWIERMLRVLRSGKPGLGIALKANMVQFSDSAERWDHEHPKISGHDAGHDGSQQHGTRSVDEALDALEALARDVAGELARLHADDAERRKRKGRPIGKAV